MSLEKWFFYGLTAVLVFNLLLTKWQEDGEAND